MPLALQAERGRADLWEDPRKGDYVVVFRRLIEAGVVSKLASDRFEKRYPYYGDALRQAAHWCMYGTLL